MQLPEYAPSLRDVLEKMTFHRDERTIEIDGQATVVDQDDLAAARLTLWLYSHLHAGNPDVFTPHAALRDAQFEQDIQARVEDRGIVVPVAPVAGSEGQLVELHRVRLRVPVGASEDRASLSLPALRPALSPGFIMYMDDPVPPRSDVPLVRHYVSVPDPAEAIELWGRSVERLCASGEQFRTKMLSRLAAYPRRDAIVVYTSGESDWVGELLREVVAQTGVRTGEASPLCTAVGPGIGRADEPLDLRPLRARQSFGEHRCSLLAEAFVTALQTGAPVSEVARAACHDGNVDPEDLSRNVRRSRQGIAT